jgi:NAD(P)-dependent dehydrogenase (short-subunit alcohol dehydrogenase family)
VRLARIRRVIKERFQLDGRCALLTGAARGIGKGIAEALAEFGCAVAIQDIDEAEARRVADEINARGGRAAAIGGDITRVEDVKEMVPRAVELLGSLHILVNNAGLQVEKHFTEQTLDEIERQFRGNLTAILQLIQIVTPIFAQQKWGRIVNIGSIQGMRGNAYMTPYAMSKAALANLTGGLARDLGPRGITINGIAPGWFDTMRNQHSLSDETRSRASKNIPVGRLGNETDCSAAAVLLCSDAGEYINGEMIVVDGGLSK